jgi:undecaprenyl diphosphate synthase
LKKGEFSPKDNLIDGIASAEISRIDLIVRWGGGRRLSGFLPIQSIYADFYVVDEMWPDFQIGQFHKALEWYQDQDVTLGG